MDGHRRLECGSRQVLTEAGWEELPEGDPSHDDQHQRRGRRRGVADEAAETDPDDGNEAYAQGGEDQGLENARMAERCLEVLTGEDSLAHSEADQDGE